jgi:Tfp pilus assembly protein FimT
MRIEKGRARGFSVIELMLVLTVLMVLMTFALVGVNRARERARLTDSTRGITNYMEKARTDSVRRHADAASQARVQILNANTYRVAFDQNSDGVLAAGETLDVALPTGVTFVTNPAPAAASYDWRGRVAAPVTYTLQNTTGTTTLTVTGAGDVSVNSTAVMPPTTSTPYPTPTPIPTTTPTPVPTPVNLDGCSIMPSPANLSIRKSGRTSGSISVSGSENGYPGTVTVLYDSTLLRLSLNGVTLTTGYTFTASATTITNFTVADIKGSGNNYTAPITFDSACGTYDVLISVTQ